MKRLLILVYGILAYIAFSVAMLYVIGFTSSICVPKAINDGAIAPFVQSVVIDLLLLLVFGTTHSAMARPGFKDRLTKIIPSAAERSTYVLVASVQFLAIFWLWQPLPFVIWEAHLPVIEWSLRIISLLGYLIVLWSSFQIDHFDLFGLRQVWLNFKGETYSHGSFTVRGLYRFTRHPLMLGFLVAFWSTPVLTVGHFLFAAVLTAYIFVGIALEERDLQKQLGEDYQRYRDSTPMIVPWIR